jgi:hypothetical protein
VYLVRAAHKLQVVALKKVADDIRAERKADAAIALSKSGDVLFFSRVK